MGINLNMQYYYSYILQTMILFVVYDDDDTV